MLAELAIDSPAAFSDLVNIAKSALSGEKVKTTSTNKAETKKEVETKKEEVAEKKDYSKMTLAELKAVAKEQGLKGYSTMKKDELISNLK